MSSLGKDILLTLWAIPKKEDVPSVKESEEPSVKESDEISKEAKTQKKENNKSD